MVLRQAVPWAMILARALLCPIIVVGAARGWDGRWLGAIVLFALADDILDGMLARRWGCDTPSLRLADSLADTVFYLGAAWALWIREPEVLRANRWLLGALFALEIRRATSSTSGSSAKAPAITRTSQRPGASSWRSRS